MQLCFITLHSSYFAQAVLSWFEMIPPAAKSIFTMQEDRHFNARIERAGALQFSFPFTQLQIMDHSIVDTTRHNSKKRRRDHLVPSPEESPRKRRASTESVNNELTETPQAGSSTQHALEAATTDQLTTLPISAERPSEERSEETIADQSTAERVEDQVQEETAHVRSTSEAVDNQEQPEAITVDRSTTELADNEGHSENVTEETSSSSADQFLPEHINNEQQIQTSQEEETAPVTAADQFLPEHGSSGQQQTESAAPPPKATEREATIFNERPVDDIVQHVADFIRQHCKRENVEVNFAIFRSFKACLLI